VYFNKGWNPEWGGNIDLWDKEIKVCHHSFAPIFNRCASSSRPARSFAAYYYTNEAPTGWDGTVHSTNFKARPDEIFKGNVLMPLEQAGQRLRSAVAVIKKTIKG
jgi:hypothetical protein